ncbi:MAG: hypothetical protein ACOC22_02670 [bacterium]
MSIRFVETDRGLVNFDYLLTQISNIKSIINLDNKIEINFYGGRSFYLDKLEFGYKGLIDTLRDINQIEKSFNGFSFKGNDYIKVLLQNFPGEL